MNRNNRYCCLVMPCDINQECNYFEIELQVKDLKKIISEINLELDTNFIYSKAKIDEKYGIILFEENTEKNEYIYELSGKNKYGKCLLISHVANFDEFIRKNPPYYENSYILNQNSTLCRNMIILCIEYILSRED